MNNLGNYPIQNDFGIQVENKGVYQRVPVSDLRKYTNGFPQTVTNISGSIVVDLNQALFFDFTLSGNVTLSFINGTPGVYIFKFNQDSTGSRLVSFPSNVFWQYDVPPTLTTTANYWDIVTLIYDGTNFSGSFTLNYSA